MVATLWQRRPAGVCDTSSGGATGGTAERLFPTTRSRLLLIGCLIVGVGTLAYWWHKREESKTADGLPTDSHLESHVRYVETGQQGVLAMKDGRSFMFPLHLDVLSHRRVVLTSLRPGVVVNADVASPVALQDPREADEYFPERGYSKAKLLRWGPGITSVDGAVVRRFDQGSPLGTVVVFHGTMTAKYAYVNGMWVEGTEDGKPFKDFVDGSWIFCTGYPITEKCKAFAQEHEFAPGVPMIDS